MEGRSDDGKLSKSHRRGRLCHTSHEHRESNDKQDIPRSRRRIREFKDNQRAHASVDSTSAALTTHRLQRTGRHMAITDGNLPLANWQFRPTKLHAYEALQTLNRCFEATLLSLERLEHLGLFRQEFL